MSKPGGPGPCLIEEARAALGIVAGGRALGLRPGSLEREVGVPQRPQEIPISRLQIPNIALGMSYTSYTPQVKMQLIVIKACILAYESDLGSLSSVCGNYRGLELPQGCVGRQSGVL